MRERTAEAVRAVPVAIRQGLDGPTLLRQVSSSRPAAITAGNASCAGVITRPMVLPGKRLDDEDGLGSPR